MLKFKYPCKEEFYRSKFDLFMHWNLNIRNKRLHTFQLHFYSISSIYLKLRTSGKSWLVRHI